ncbi:ferredoxin [Patescibacteria group bacterium]
MQIEVDQNKCIGSQPCTKISPTVFKLGDDGKAYILDPKGDTDEQIQIAAKACPVGAIILKDEDGNVVFPK